jgi:hypothetical protein
VDTTLEEDCLVCLKVLSAYILQDANELYSHGARSRYELGTLRIQDKVATAATDGGSICLIKRRFLPTGLYDVTGQETDVNTSCFSCGFAQDHREAPDSMLFGCLLLQ